MVEDFAQIGAGGAGRVGGSPLGRETAAPDRAVRGFLLSKPQNRHEVYRLLTMFGANSLMKVLRPSAGAKAMWSSASKPVACLQFKRDGVGIVAGARVRNMRDSLKLDATAIQPPG